MPSPTVAQVLADAQRLSQASRAIINRYRQSKEDFDKSIALARAKLREAQESLATVNATTRHHGR